MVNGRAGSLAELVDAAAARAGRTVAIAGSGEGVAYAALADLAARLASYLLGRGLPAGATVAVSARSVRTQALALLAVMKAGGRCLLLSPESSGADLRALRARFDCTALLGDVDDIARVGPGRGAPVALDARAREIQTCTPHPPRIPDPNSTAWLSAAIGADPVAVSHEDAAAGAMALASRLRLEPAAKMLILGDLVHADDTSAAMAGLVAGATVLCARPTSDATAGAIAAALDAWPIDVAIGRDEAWQRLRRSGWSGSGPARAVIHRTGETTTSPAPEAPEFVSRSRLLSDAFALAVRAHGGRTRKVDGSAYVDHPIAVAALLQRHGVRDETALAVALLHDAVEAGGASSDDLRAATSEEVTRQVLLLTDGVGLDWETRKRELRARVAAGPPQAQAVLVADALHNARALAEALAREGARAVAERLSSPPAAKLSYYRAVFAGASAAVPPELVDELRRTVLRLEGRGARDHVLRATIIGVGFRVEAERREDLGYFDAFLGAYDGDGAGAERCRYEVVVRRGDAPEPLDGAEPRWVHETKHPYWRIQARPAPDGWLIWTRPGVATRVTEANRRVEVLVAPSRSSAEAGEAAFHVCRSLALYSRDPAWSFLHASGVVAAGGAVLFTGDECAGKTTLMTEAVINGGAAPFTNDRVLVSPSAVPRAVSWPAYASYTEGTLLSYPALARAARSYESDRCLYRTQRWPRPLARVFTKDRKRVFPMRWLSDAVGRGYVPGAALRGLIVCRVGTDVSRTVISRVDLDREARWLEEVLERQSFDRSEPSWRPWHELPLPAGAPPVPDLIERLRTAGVRVHRLEAAPGDYGPLLRCLRALSAGDRRPWL